MKEIADTQLVPFTPSAVSRSEPEQHIAMARKLRRELLPTITLTFLAACVISGTLACLGIPEILSVAVALLVTSPGAVRVANLLRLAEDIGRQILERTTHVVATGKLKGILALHPTDGPENARHVALLENASEGILIDAFPDDIAPGDSVIIVKNDNKKTRLERDLKTQASA